MTAGERAVLHAAKAVAILAVVLVGPALAEDIRDIRGPKFIIPGWLVLAALAAAAVLSAGGYYGWRRWQRRRRARRLLPYQIALERLERLRGIMQPLRAREFSSEVSGVVRLYIEQRFALTATHRTTEEFMQDLLASADAALARHRERLAQFLEQCDLVKFAGVSLTLPHMAALHDSARAFVLDTAQPDPPTPAQASAPLAA